jgi:hypothetical protein
MIAAAKGAAMSKYNRGLVHFTQMIIKEEGKISCFKHA